MSNCGPDPESDPEKAEKLEKEIWSVCKCGEEKEGYPEVDDYCPACRRIGCYTLDEENEDEFSNI